MKKFVLKAAVLAISALAGASASAAAVDLDAASPVSIKYANEMVISTSANLRHGAAADQTATTTFGASFGSDVTAYVRVDIAGGTFAGTPASTMFAVNDSTPAAATVSVAQSGTNYVIFAVTPAAGKNLVAANAATIDTDTGTATGLTVTSKAGVTMQYRLFETLTAAANPAANNTLKDTGAVAYAAFSNALSTTITSLTKTADVAASPSYTGFTNNTGALAKVQVALATVAEADGSALTAAELLAATNKVTVNGDFTFLKNDDATYTGAALGRIFLNDNVDCTAGAPTVAAANTLSATSAVFSGLEAALVDDHWVCVTPEGTPEIAAGTYTADIDFVAEAAYALSDVTGSAAGTVNRNGVRMVAPLAQTPGTYLSRLVITNTGSSDRDYTITYAAENGTTVTLTGDAAGGSVAAGKTKVIDLHNLMTITGAAPRASLIVTVNAPQSEIDGLYQLGNASTGAFTNHILSYKN